MHAAVRSSLLFCAALTLSSCARGPSYSYQNVTVAMSPQITTIAVGATQTFSTTTVNAPNYPTWFAGPGTAAVSGSVAFTAGSSTAVYTAPPVPPIYTAQQLSAGAVQGKVNLTAFVPNTLTSIFSDASAVETITITAPSITTGIAPPTATVARGATQQFTGYAVGNVNGALTWQVNGATGGSTANGTITATGLYTAPSAIPIAGPTVSVTAVSVADPTKSATATVTVN